MNKADVTMRPGETRELRAAHDILRRGRFEEIIGSLQTMRTFRVTDRSGKIAIVSADPSWSQASTCNCYDQSMNDQYAPGRVCRHIVAVWIHCEELRCQLLDLFL